MSLSERLGSLSHSKEETPPPRREEVTVEPPEPPAGRTVQRCVIIQRDERGYGLTVSGDNPVFVQSVKDNGAAARAGVQQGDRIVKVNGTLVINSNHIEVVKLIKSGSYVALTLLGRPPAQQNRSTDLSSSPSQPSKPPSPPAVSHPAAPTDQNRLSTCITGPQPVDARKSQELLQLKLDTLKAMHNQAVADYENIRRDRDYGKNPEKLKSLLEEKLKTVKTLETNLHTLVIVPGDKYIIGSAPSRDSGTGESLEPIPEPGAFDFPSYRHPSWSKSLPSTVLDGNIMSESPQLTPNTSPTPTHPQNHPDGEIPYSTSNHTDPHRRDSGVGTMSEDASTSSSGTRLIAPQQVDVISIEDDEFSEEEEEQQDHGPFLDLNLLEKRPAHMAVFLHYCISNSDPSPLFFHIVTDVYSNSQGSVKDLRKWAYEIMSTFLVNNAPLKVEVEESVILTIEEALQSRTDKEDLLRSMFGPARAAARSDTNELLADFRRQKSLGLGNIYGVHELPEKPNRNKDTVIINKYLLPHLDRLLTEEDEGNGDRNVPMAAALVTFLKQVGGIKSTSGGSAIERCPSFVAKDKRSIKLPGMMNKKNQITVKGHLLVAQHYTQVTHCSHCHNIIGGIGYTGFLCSSCEANYHKNCVNSVEDCAGSKKKKRMSVLSDIKIRKQSNVTNPASAKEPSKSHDDKSEPSTPLYEYKPLSDEKDPDLNRLKEQGHSVGNLVKIYEETAKTPENEESPTTKKKGTEIGRSESMKGRGDQRGEKSSGTRRTKSDVDVDETLKSLNNSGSSSTSSLSTSNSSEAVNDIKQLIEEDSDFEVETELPPLKHLCNDDTFKKLKPKEKKRQEVINELFYTERSHVRNLKVLDRVFLRPMMSEPHNIHHGLVQQLFPNLPQMIQLHSSLNNAMKAKRKENPVVTEVGDILLQRFEGEAGCEFREGCAIYCRNQSYALEQLRIKQRRDEKFARLLSETESNPLCRRLQLKDLIPTAFQRLTKYPLLIENLMKYTMTNAEEYSRLEQALKRSKSILDYVNQAVKECENYQRLAELNKKLDRRPMENSNNPVVVEFKNLDLTAHKLVHEGTLTWRLSRNKQIDLHVVLLEDILVLLQKQDDKLVLKCQSTTVVTGKDDTKYTHSPVVRLTNLLTRNVATDKKAFFLVSNPNLKPQIYELVSISSEDRKRWFKHITEAADAYKQREKEAGPSTPSHSHNVNNSGLENQASHQDPEQITVIRPQIKTPSRTRKELGSGSSDGPQVSPTPFSATSSDVLGSDDSVLERAGISISDIPESDNSQLIQPEDVKVTDPLIARAEAVLTPQAPSPSAVSGEVSAEGGAPVGENSPSPAQSTLTIPVPMDKLRHMADRMNTILSNLLTVVGNKEQEQERMRQELKSAQAQMVMLRELQQTQRSPSDSFSRSERPSSMISVGSSMSETMEESQASVDALHRLLMGGDAAMIRAEDVLLADPSFTQSTDLDSFDAGDMSVQETDDPGLLYGDQLVTDVDDAGFQAEKTDPLEDGMIIRTEIEDNEGSPMQGYGESDLPSEGADDSLQAQADQTFLIKEDEDEADISDSALPSKLDPISDPDTSQTGEMNTEGETTPDNVSSGNTQSQTNKGGDSEVGIGDDRTVPRDNGVTSAV